MANKEYERRGNVLGAREVGTSLVHSAAALTEVGATRLGVLVLVEMDFCFGVVSGLMRLECDWVSPSAGR